MTLEREPTEAPIVVGGREQLLHLLAEASEIEHTLMCSYLYAAFSLKSGASGEFSPDEVAAVERWRKSILSVAMDEMVHLLLVANLTIAVGGRPHFGRPNFPVEPGYFPSGVVVRLTPFSLDTLDHFVFLERPRGEEMTDGDGFEHEREYEREAVVEGLMPTLQDYRTIGHLYAAIRANLQSLHARLGPARLFVGPVSGQVDRDAVSLPGVGTAHDLDSALHLVDTIVEQGEGSPAQRDDSHYDRFRAMRAEYADLLHRHPGFMPAHPAAESPVMRRPPQPEDKVFVDHPAAARVLDFANAVYGLLLRFLVQAFGRSGPRGRAAMQRHLDAAIGLMHVLDRLARALASMPAQSGADTPTAGMSFTMLRSVDPIFAGEAEAQLLAERLQELCVGAQAATAAHPALQGVAAQLTRIAVGFSASD